VDEIEKKIERRVEFRGQGRPGKSDKNLSPFSLFQKCVRIARRVGESARSVLKDKAEKVGNNT
jgi:hypothetical protein